MKSNLKNIKIYSQLLIGKPSDVLAKIGFSNPTNPIFKIHQQLREKITSQEHQKLLQVVERIV